MARYLVSIWDGVLYRVTSVRFAYLCSWLWFVIRVAVDLDRATCSLFWVSHVCSINRYCCEFNAALSGSSWVEVMEMSSA